MHWFGLSSSHASTSDINSLQSACIVCRRSLCYAFGNQWNDLAMTSTEFEVRHAMAMHCTIVTSASVLDSGCVRFLPRLCGQEISKPYLTRKPHAKGQPQAFVLWQKFTNDLQVLPSQVRCKVRVAQQQWARAYKVSVRSCPASACDTLRPKA